MDSFRNGNGWHAPISGIEAGSLGETGEEDHYIRLVVFTDSSVRRVGQQLVVESSAPLAEIVEYGLEWPTTSTSSTPTPTLSDADENFETQSWEISTESQREWVS